PVAALRARGITTVVVSLDGAAFDRIARAERERAGEIVPPLDPAVEEQRAPRTRALRHALAEYELKVHAVLPGEALGEPLVGCPRCVVACPRWPPGRRRAGSAC